MKGLGEGQIVLLDEGFAAKPAPGSKVVLRFKPPESHGPTPDRVAEFALAGLLPMKGDAADPYLTPDFPGITDRDDIGAWDLPFEDEDWKKSIATEYGDGFWKKARGAPKAYIRLEKGKELWGSSRFGELTSIRLASTDAERYRDRLLRKLKPAEGGFVFEDLAKQAGEASGGAIPFGLYFLCFSFFLIAAALLLVVLLYRLNLERRAAQVGLLLAEGFRIGTVRRLYLAEGGLLALLGVALGAFLALAYSRLLLRLLASLWPGGALQGVLEPHASPWSLACGIAGSLAASLLAIAWSVRVLGKAPPRALLAGQSADEAGQSGRGWIAPALFVAGLAGGAALIVLGPMVPGAMAQAGTFFGAGALFLTAGLAGARLLMRMKGGPIGRGALAVGRMGLRNAARHPLRSLLTVGLLASSAFLIVAIESFRQQARPGDGSIDAPDGGFSLVAESDLPVIRDLNSPRGRQEILKGMGEGKAEAEALLEQTSIVALRARAGDDASCLNLYKPTAPRVLGVPASLIDRGGFVFDGVEGDKKNPWQALRGAGMPAFAESNTATYMLDKALGGKIAIDDERGTKAELRLGGAAARQRLPEQPAGERGELPQAVSLRGGLPLFPHRPAGGARGRRETHPGARPARQGVRSDALGGQAGLVPGGGEHLPDDVPGAGRPGAGAGIAGHGGGAAAERVGAAERAGPARAPWAGGAPWSAGWCWPRTPACSWPGWCWGRPRRSLSIVPQLLSGKGAIPWANLGLLFASVLAVSLASSIAATWAALRAPHRPGPAARIRTGGRGSCRANDDRGSVRI